MFERTPRVKSLDGLRGVAAVVVVLFHAAVVSPALADAARGLPAGHGAVTSFPLRLLWSGEEAVTVFFVLSGFVLTLPTVKGTIEYRPYVVRRLVRLFLPVWASVVVALAAIILVPRMTEEKWSWWMNAHGAAVTPRQVLANVTLVAGASWFNSPLWSLKWEVWFSVLLPLYVWLLIRRRRHWAIDVVLCLGAIQLGWAVPVLEGLKYLGIFGLGVALAGRWSTLAPRVSRVRRVAGAGLLVAALLLLEARWLLGGVVVSPSLTAAGGTLLVILVGAWPPAVRAVSAPVLLWLGDISFSLYLVHEPIVVSVATILHTTNARLVLGLSLPVAVLVAWLFHRIIEAPSNRFSRVVEDRVKSRLDPAAHRMSLATGRANSSVTGHRRRLRRS